MLHRIRLAMQKGDFFKKLTGEIEVDETFIGGKARNMHKGRRKAKGQWDRGAQGRGYGTSGKTWRRSGRSGWSITPKRSTLHPVVRTHVEKGAQVFTDVAGVLHGT